MTLVGIVTGAARGMGAACAARVVDMVDVLLLVDRDEASLVDAAKKLSGGSHRAQVEPVSLDITDVSGLERLAAACPSWARCAPWPTLPGSRRRWRTGERS